MMNYDDFLKLTSLDVVDRLIEEKVAFRIDDCSFDTNSNLKHLNSLPYFKVYNSIKPVKGSKVVRLHFKDSECEYHHNVGKMSIYNHWRITSKDSRIIRNILLQNNLKYKLYSNWNVLCHSWNVINKLIPDDSFIEYMNSNFDISNGNKISYVPSYQPIPDNWIYDKKKEKY